MADSVEHKVTVTAGMSAEEFIGRMCEAYGDEFNWRNPSVTKTFVDELITELGEDDPFVLNRSISLAAKCESCDDMLFCSTGTDGSELWRIYHLTFSHCREKTGFPLKWEFRDRKSALEYIRDMFIEDYL